MDHKNEISQLLDTVIACGENMAKLGRLLKEYTKEPEESAATEIKSEPHTESKPTSVSFSEKQEEPAAKTYTFVDVRKAFSAKSHAGYTAQVKELIGLYGADRLSDIKEADYPSLMADLEVIR